MFKAKLSKKTIVTAVVNNELYFILLDGLDDGRICKKISLDQFLNNSTDSLPIFEELRDKTHSFLILPDYWSGNTSFLFQSKRRSLAKAFVERKLLTEYPDLPDIKYFFDFTFPQTGFENRKIYVSYLLEPRAFQLYQKLSELHLNPVHISTPALLWEQKLMKIIPDFHIDGTCLIHLLSPECFLYFFYQGYLLFSRNITFPDDSRKSTENSRDLYLESPSRMSLLTYELNQSIYLFSQKTKSDMNKIYLYSSDVDNGKLLSENLGKEVLDINTGIQNQRGLQESLGISEYLGPMGSFDPVDLSPSKLKLNLTHISLKKIQKWKSVQTVGLVVGLALLLLLAMESLFLWKWPIVRQDRPAQNIRLSGAEQKQLIQKYSQALDLILSETNRPSPRKVVINIGRSLPDNTRITDMDIETETNPGVVINGVIKASGADQLKDTLSTLLDNLNQYFQGTRSLSIQDVDFKVDKSKKEQAHHNFLFTLKFNLP